MCDSAVSVCVCVCVCEMEVGVEQEGLEECQDHSLSFGGRNNLGAAGKASSVFP